LYNKELKQYYNKHNYRRKTKKSIKKKSFTKKENVKLDVTEGFLVNKLITKKSGFTTTFHIV